MNESSVFLFSGRDEFETGKGLVYLRPIFRLTKISLPLGQSYTEKEYYNGSQNLNLNSRERLMINLK